jgi:hypothetical protein
VASYSAVIDLRVQGEDRLRAVTDKLEVVESLTKRIKPVPTLFDKRGTEELLKAKQELSSLVKQYADGNTRVAKFSTSIAGLGQQLSSFRTVAANARVNTDEFNNALKAAEITSGRLLSAELKRFTSLQNIYTRQSVGGLTAEDRGPSKMVRDLMEVRKEVPNSIAALRTYAQQLDSVFQLVEGGSQEYRQLQQAIAAVNKQMDMLQGQGPVQGPAAPPRAPRPGGPLAKTPFVNPDPGFENLALGAGFPLLFGGGAGQVAGGLLGSFVGTGFGGQILGSAIGQQLEDALRRITDISNASRTLNLDTLRESAIAVNAELAISVEQLKKAGQGEAARAAIASRVALQTGLLPEETQATAQAVGTLNTAWNEVVGAVSGLLSILGRPIVSALAVILQGIAKAVQGVNLLLQLLFKHVPVLSQIAWLFNEINKRLPFINEEQEKQYTAAVAMTDQLNKEIMLNNKIIDIQKQRTLGLTLAERQINAGLDAQLAGEKIRAEFDQKRAEINTKLAETTDARARRELKLALEQTNALETQALRQQDIQDLLALQGIQIERNNEKYQQAADAVQRQRDALERSNAITQSRLSAESALNDLYGAQLQRQYELATTAQQRFNIAIKQFYQQVAAADIEYRQAKANNELLIQKAQLEYKLVEIKYQQIAAEKALGVAQAITRGNTPEQVQAIAGAYDKALAIQTEIIQASRDQISATVQIAKNQDQIAAAVYQTKLIQAESQLAQRLTSNEIGLSKQSADRLAGSLAVGVMQASKMQSALYGVSNAAATAAANIARATGQSYVVTQRTEQATATGNVMTAQYQYANGTTGYSYIKAHYAKGGYVNSPTVAMIGEGGQGEYVVPESKAAAFAMNYMLGARGAGAIDGNASSPAINITTGPVMQQGGQNYVTIQDMEAGLQAVADTILNNSRSYSSRRFTGVA